MTRPQMIRADTIDLQDPLSPSAKDHSRPSTNGTRNRHGHAQHQDQALRIAERDMLDEISRGPLSPDFHKDDRGIDEDYAYDGHNKPDHVNGLQNDRMGDYEHHMEGDAADGDIDDQLDDDMLDKISSSPSIDDEDIDFEFVYALHTFFATVEGQANATKGDTMVLLDDSNSYWWLVRVLSATMLGDNAEKSKNPLKKAMRRRNAKTVTFASPTYFEASDIDYSTEEEDIDDPFFEEEEEEEGEGQAEGDDAERSSNRDTQAGSKNSNMTVEPLRPKPLTDKEPAKAQDEEPVKLPSESIREVEEPASQQEDFRHGRSRNGVFRNTDSFFKDDMVETKKISLTPNLLRDDANETSQVTESKEMRGRGSFEALTGDRNKDDKKRKEKKSGMLSGLFKRKDKKSKAPDDDGEEHEKVSEESARSSTERKMSVESLKEETRAPKLQAVSTRPAAKLQKQPAVAFPQTPDSTSPSKNNVTPSVRAVAPDLNEDVIPLTIRARVPEIKQSPPIPTDSVSNSAASPTAASSVQNTSAPSTDIADKPIDIPTPTLSPVMEESRAAELHSEPEIRKPSLDMQPVESPPVASARVLSPDETSVSPHSLSQPSSDILDVQQPKTENTTPANAVSSPPQSPEWNDAGLRAYLDDGSEIRDLLIIVHDMSNVPPAGPDHPIVGGLFKDESKSLNDMSNRLDEMLNGWLARKSAVAVR
ncbi:predicted protein [Uncinocarpus reesii 1704]|uniref:SH3 domain-containing protein n=1 Tax=Uncinocarpus reesii (strain UAMH 1704) TaxID=336963 RepID=C4JQJ0_UNCRE|nr:uncharacterized protein UREG_03335 [Uncinocarpus reesii 1704]EEP78489.1 predicted protein [Uncinocarpus reesii 1704]